jgi:alpha-glucosidase
LENSRATFDGLRTIDPDIRPFVLTRATYAGGQRYAATWTGDNSSSWNHLRLATPMLENLGLSGFAFSGADVGGYAGTPSPELLTKWLEVGAFQPIYRDHTEKGTNDQEPWVGTPEQEAVRRHFIETRYQLMPYIYTLAEEATRNGLPMLRPLFLEFPDAAPDRRPIDTDSFAAGEFLLGNSLLVAPQQYPGELDAYSVELPSPDWFDYWTGVKIAQPPPPARNPEDLTAAPERTAQFLIKITPDLKQLPVFVRGGSILPISPLVQSTNETPQGPLTLRVYAGNQCAGDLYQDDGKTYAFQHGAFLRMNFSCQITDNGMQLKIGPHQGTYPAWWKDIHVEIYGWTPKQGEVVVDSKKLSGPIDHTSQALGFTFADDGKGAEVIVK